MVLHAGIECYRDNGSLVIYDSESKNEVTHRISVVQPNDINGVDEFFRSIASHFTSELGNVSICLGNTYDSDIREKFIQSAKSFGFSKVEIVDWCSSNYCDLLKQAKTRINYQLKQGDVVWLFCGSRDRKSYYVWEKMKNQAKFLHKAKYEDTPEHLMKIKESAKKPSLILYPNANYTIPYQAVSAFFNDSRLYAYRGISQAEGACIKARILAGDPEVTNFNVMTILERDVALRIASKTVLTVNQWVNLPFSKQETVKELGDAKILEIVSNKKPTIKTLPQHNPLTINLRIDENGIVNVKFPNKQAKESNGGDGVPETTPPSSSRPPSNLTKNQKNPKVSASMSSLTSENSKKGGGGGGKKQGPKPSKSGPNLSSGGPPRGPRPPFTPRNNAPRPGQPREVINYHIHHHDNGTPPPTSTPQPYYPPPPPPQPLYQGYQSPPAPYQPPPPPPSYHNSERDALVARLVDITLQGQSHQSSPVTSPPPQPHHYSPYPPPPPPQQQPPYQHPQPPPQGGYYPPNPTTPGYYPPTNYGDKKGHGYP